MACRGCSTSGCACSVTGAAGGVITVSGSGTPVTDPYKVAFHGDQWMASLTENTAACTSLSAPKVPVLLGDGSTVLRALPCSTTGLNGVPGGDTFRFTFDGGSIADSNPSTGYARFDSLTMPSVTKIFVSTTETYGSNVAPWMDSFGTGRIRCYLVSNPLVWIEFILTGVTTASGYRKLNVTYVGNNGVFTNGLADFAISFAPSGPTGATGATGAAGVLSPQTVSTTKTAGFVLALTDAEKFIPCGTATVVVSVPLNATVAFPIGTHIDFWAVSAGHVSFTPATAGVTIQSDSSYLNLFTQYTGATLVKIATDTWALMGKLS